MDHESVLPSIETVARRVDGLRARYAARDARMLDVRAVRHGNFDTVAPDLFSEDWPRPIVANLINDSATAAAGALAPLPSVTCRTANSVSDAARAWADKRTKIAKNYFVYSDVQGQNHTGADQYFTYGMIVTCIEPDFDGKMPRIVHEDSLGIYPTWDRKGDTIEVARVFQRTAAELVAEYPEHEARILRGCTSLTPGAEKLEIVKYVSGERICMYIPKAGNLVLYDTPNPLGKCYYVCTKKPGLDAEIRGSYDDLIWVQLARHALQIYALEAAQKSVQAPIVVGTDVGDIPTGPDAIIRTNGGVQSVGRVNLQVPNQVWGGIDHLKQEMLTSAAVPPSPGSIDASIITGSGVRELMGGYSQQIATAQVAMQAHFRRVMSLAFRMDEKFWPNARKSLRGLADGVPYDEKYVPARDIKGDDTIEVAYGFAAGLDANRALVLVLQSQGAGLVSRDYARRALPAGVDAAAEESKILTEQMRDSIMQGMSALAQSIPAMVSNGQDPTSIVKGIAEITDRLQKGEALEKIVTEVFAPEPEPEAPPGLPSPADPSAPDSGGGDGSSGFGPNGMPSGLTPGEATGGQNERPDLQMMFAGLTGNGQPTLQAGVSRYAPTR